MDSHSCQKKEQQIRAMDTGIATGALAAAAALEELGWTSETQRCTRSWTKNDLRVTFQFHVEFEDSPAETKKALVDHADRHCWSEVCQFLLYGFSKKLQTVLENTELNESPDT